MNEEETKNMLINPFYAIQIASMFTLEHEFLCTKEQWIGANSKLIDEIGKEEWLGRLLSILESGK